MPAFLFNFFSGELNDYGLPYTAARENVVYARTD